MSATNKRKRGGSEYRSEWSKWQKRVDVGVLEGQQWDGGGGQRSNEWLSDATQADAWPRPYPKGQSPVGQPSLPAWPSQVSSAHLQTHVALNPNPENNRQVSHEAPFIPPGVTYRHRPAELPYKHEPESFGHCEQLHPQTQPASTVTDLTLSEDDGPPPLSQNPSKGQRAANIANESKLTSSATKWKTGCSDDVATPVAITDVRTCSCGKPAIEADSTVNCANGDCAFRTFHKACVGLSSRKVTVGWRCWKCRPAPPPPISSQRSTLPNVLPSSSPASAPQPPSYTPPTISPAQGPADPPLHPEQARIVECILQGSNVFYTGSAGTGKSFVLKSFVQGLKKQGKHVDIIAPSGIAALNVGGTTVYAYAGWRPDTLKLPLHKIKSMAHGRNIRKRLCKTDVLVVDEISMVERDLLVRLDRAMRESRDRWSSVDGKPMLSPHTAELPFGGCQVVVTGDFCQLPPVKPFRTCLTCGGDDLPGYQMQDGRTMACGRCGQAYEDKDKWAFRSDTWDACDFRYFELKHIHRQSDKRFIDILQRCRYGQALLLEQQAVLLQGKPDPIGAVKLLPRRVEVENENLRNFNGLRSTPREYDCMDCFFWKNKLETDLEKKGAPRYQDRPDGPLLALKDHRMEEEIKLKEGMLVILLVNLDFKLGLVNGSQGKIVGFETHDEKKVFAPPAPSTADTSPAKRGRFAKDNAPRPEYVQIKEAEIRKFIGRAALKQWPVVQFHNGVVQPIYAHCQLNELGGDEPYSLIGRTQIPLLAAWAITVHKSQGMTLDRVIVDLYNSFEREMVYVALSRARSLQGLKVVRLARNMSSQGVNEEVQQFLKEHGLGGCE